MCLLNWSVSYSCCTLSPCFATWEMKYSFPSCWNVGHFQVIIDGMVTHADAVRHTYLYRRPQARENHLDLLLRMLQTKDQYNMDQKDLPALLVKCTVLSLKYVDRRPLFETLFPGHFADWALVDRVLSANNAPGDAEAWLCLVGLIEWQGLINKDRVDTNHAPLAQIKAALKAHKLDSPGWEEHRLNLSLCSLQMVALLPRLQESWTGLRTPSSPLARTTRSGLTPSSAP